MMLSKRKTHHEQIFNELIFLLIGKKFRIVKSKIKSLEGLDGEIIRETSHTFIVKTNQRLIRVIKKDQIFLMHLMDGTKVIVDGSFLEGTMESRKKRKVRNW